MSDEILVCIVDDDESVRNALARLIASAGYRTRTYSGAQPLLDDPPAYGAVPTVVLTDYRMPGLDGIGLAEQLAAAPVPPAIVFLTGHGSIPTTVRAIRNGAIDFLEKPVETDTLLDALARAGRWSRDRVRTGQVVQNLRDRYSTLTSRERQVCALIVSGLINKEAAWELGISEKTIKVHRARVVEKMRARSLPDLVRMAGSLGIAASVR